MKVQNKIALATSAAALLSSGFIATPIHAAPKMVKCVIETGRSCGNGCPQKTEIMTREECENAGGTPYKIDRN